MKSVKPYAMRYKTFKNQITLMENNHSMVKFDLTFIYVKTKKIWGNYSL